jgi:polyhydroxyalkanoate synthesis regulator phasin
MPTLFERGFLGRIGLLSMTYEKAQKIVDELTRRREVQKDEAKEWVDRLVQRGEHECQSLRRLIHDEVKSTLDELCLVTKQDFRDLSARIDTLGKQEKG